MKAQKTDYTWWNDAHNWDGVTPWSDYIIMSAANMGPNALPVPEIKNGKTLVSSQAKVAYQYHHSKGEKTQNIWTEVYFPLFSDRVGINFSMVPFEHFKMDSLTNFERASREQGGEGTAVGDLYIGTYIQLIKNHEKLPDVLLTINLKTASGNMLEAARYTDGPGYYFDLSFGKDYELKANWIDYIRPYAIAGLYIYQTNRTDYYQNDAVIYGLGVDLSFDKFLFKNSWGGYSGYFGNGDKPMVYRSEVSSNFDQALNYELKFQTGLHDFDYTTISAGIIVKLSKKIDVAEK